MNYSNPSNSTFNYEETVAQIETIIDRIESGELTIEQVFQQFGVAVEDLQKCEEFLARGQQQMNLAIETLEDEF